jgi:hypothetical protein
MTRGRAAMPNRILEVFNCRRISRPTDSCNDRNINACFCVIAPDAKGRVFVRSTLASSFLSHKSFIVHPAPRG